MVWPSSAPRCRRRAGRSATARDVPGRAGRWLSFLFVWQLTFSAPLSMASGCIGFAQYAGYCAVAHADHHLDEAPDPDSGHRDTTVEFTITNGTFVAMGVAAFAVLLLYRRITVIGRMAAFLWIGVVGTTLWIIGSGVTHFSAAQAFSFPPDTWTLTPAFFTGLGAALLIAVYDYWGYYNVCYLGARSATRRVSSRAPSWLVHRGRRRDVPDDEHLDPRSMPWQEVEKSSFIASDFMAAHLGSAGGRRRDGPDAVDRLRVRLLAVAGYSRVP